jgi:N-acetylneuraminic acid mutarotase
MNRLIKFALYFSLIASSIFYSCTKNKFVPHPISYFGPPPPPPPPPVQVPCENRPIINATLVPIGSLSVGRTGVLAASAGNKILFIGGMHAGQNWWNEPVPADIYDMTSNSWSNHLLEPDDPQATHFRSGAAIAALEDKIFFAGGGDGFGDNQTSQVDIYNASSGTWSRKQLSSERQYLTAATVGDKVFFAGGFGYPNGGNWGEFNTVDIYDNSNDSWSTATLSEARMDITATTAGNKIYFAGGRTDFNASKTIDIYDAATNSWSVSSLQQPRTGMASIAAGGKIFWSAGANSGSGTGWAYNNDAEILDLTTGVTSTTCVIPRSWFSAVRKNDKLVFFTGISGGDGTQFEIYDTVSGIWSTGQLNMKIQGAAIISVNNTIYVAGGMVNGAYSAQVWKLDF